MIRQSNVFSGNREIHINMGTDFDTTMECSSMVIFLLHCRVSTVIPVVPPLPEGSDWEEKCFIFLDNTFPVCHNSTLNFSGKVQPIDFNDD